MNLINLHKVSGPVNEHLRIFQPFNYITLCNREYLDTKYMCIIHQNVIQHTKHVFIMLKQTIF